MPSGVFADRMGRKYTLIAGGLIAARFGFRLTIALAAGIIPLVFTAGGLPARQHSQQKYDLPQPVGAYLAEYDVNEEIRR